MVLAAGLTGWWLIPHDSKRDDVAQYIVQVNETGRTFATEYKDVEAAYRKFSTAPGAQSKQVRRLQSAANRLAQLRTELADVPAPPQARELRKRLIAFYDGQVRVANEVVALMTYFPQLVQAERSLGPAAARMQKSVGGAKTPEAQAAALGGYADALEQAAARVEALDAPPILAQAKLQEHRRLTGVMRSIRGVRSALLAHDRTALQKAVKRLAAASDVAAVATRSAVVAYNRDVKRIQKLGVRVEVERRRLDKTL